MRVSEESKVFSVNTDMCTEMYDDVVDGRAVDLNKCLLCVSTLNNALVLDCHHVFCAPCLRDFNKVGYTGEDTPPPCMNDALNVVCPTCRESSAKTWQDLSFDLDTKQGDNSDGRAKTHKNSDSSMHEVQNCDVCEFNSKIEESEIYCSKCSLNLCEACKNIHANHLLFKSHHVIHISNKYSVTLYCKRHNKHQCSYYCNECRIPCCAVCILQNHASHSSTTFMESVTQKKERVKAVMDNLGPQLDKLENRLKKIMFYDELRSRNNSSSYPSRLKFNKILTNNDLQNVESAAGSMEEMPQNGKKGTTKSNNVTPQDTPKRKRKFSLFDNDKKRSKDVGIGPRKVSFFANGKNRGLTEPVITERPRVMITKRQTSAFEMTSPRSKSMIPSTPTSDEDTIDLGASSPQRTVALLRSPKMGTGTLHMRSSSLSSTGSTNAWHPFVRMGKSSPLMARRSGSTLSNPEMERDGRKTSKERRPSPPQPQQRPQQLQHQESLTIPVFVNVDKTEIEGFFSKVKVFRKLYDLAAKSLQMGHSKKLLDFYDLLALHIRSVADNEVQEIKRKVRDVYNEVENVISHLTPTSSMASIDIISAESRKPSRASSADSIAEDEENSDRELSLLIKPVLIWKKEKNKSESGDLWNRCGISFLPNGNVIVAEYDLSNVYNNRLHVYDKTGSHVKVLCEEKVSPLGVAVTPDGQIAVTDSKSKKIIKITETGEIVSEWGKGQFGWPHGIAVTSKGYFVVSDAFNDVVSVHLPDGKLIRRFGSSGSGNTHFRNPYHVAVDRHDNIIVSDCGNNCIKVFNINGEFLFTNRGVSASAIDGFDQKYRRLKAPRGVAVDPKGNILVADDNNRVCLFDCRGKYVRNILTEEENVKYVEGLACNASGDLALTECNPANMIAVKMFHLYTRDIEGPVHQESFRLSHSKTDNVYSPYKRNVSQLR